MTKKSKIIYIVGSIIIGVVALLAVLLGLIAGGVIDSRQTKLVFASQSYEFVYDGTTHTYDKWELVTGELRENHRAEVIVSGAQCEVGESPNYISATISDDNGADVTEYYQIEYQPGTLKVVSNAITVKSADAVKIYDGAPLVAENYELIEGELAEGHSIVAAFGASITQVGTAENAMTVAVTDSDGRDVTANYNITVVNGTLEVTKRQVVFTSSSSSMVYDGTTLKLEEYEVSEGSIAEGQQAGVAFNASITNVGTAENQFSAVIYAADGVTDVTANYDISCLYGVLEITQRPITITTQGAEKVYDGTPLTEDGYDITEGSIADGQELTVQLTGTQTNAGMSDNSANVTVYDAEDINVTANYKVTIVSGTLDVTKRPITITADGAEKVYDGTPLTEDGYDITEGSIAEGQELTVQFTGTQTNAGTSDNSATATVYDAEDNNVTANYNITVVNGTLEVTKRQVVFTSSSSSMVYDGTALKLEEYEISEGSIAEGQQAGVAFNASITNVGTAQNQFSAVIYAADGVTDVTANYDISCLYGVLEITQRPITITTQGAEKVYDGTPLTEDGYDITEGSVADGQKLAVQLTGTQTNAGVNYNNANVTVYDAEDNNVTVNYNITVISGTLEVTQRPITITTDGAEKVYDGTPLTKDGYDITEGSIVEGQELTVQLTGTQTNAGVSYNNATVTVYDAEDNNVTANYNITVVNGTLEVTKRQVVFTSSSSSMVYDGTTLKLEEYEVSEGSIAEGQQASVAFNASITNVGTAQNQFSAVIYASDGVTDVTANYDISCLYGTLEVTQRPITITTQGAEKVYDGTPLTKDGYEITEGSVADGQKLAVQFTGTQTNAGVSSNNANVTVYDSEDNNVTVNYNITVISGTLEVTHRPITITTQGAEKVYDGTPLTEHGYEITEGSIADGQQLNIDIFGSIVDVGETDNSAGITITDASGYNVVTNYAVTMVFGSLKVNPYRIAISTVSSIQIYNGQPLTCMEYSISSEDQLLEGHSITSITMPSSMTDVGVCDNLVTDITICDAHNNEVTHNYQIDYFFGTLSVSPRPLTIRSGSASKIYDGDPLVCNESEIVSITQPVSGHSVQVAVTGTRTEIGESDNTIGEVIVMDGDRNVTLNYDISTEYGILVVKGEPTGSGGGGTGGDTGEGGTGEGGTGEGGTGSGSGGGINIDISGNLGLGPSGGGQGDDTVCVRVYSDVSGPVYLRLISYGDLVGTKWESAVEYDKTLDGQYSYNYLSGAALKAAGYSENNILIQVMGTQYFLPYYMAMGSADYVIQTSDVMYSGPTEDIYGLSYYLYDITEDGRISASLGDYTDEEEAYRDYVYSMYRSYNISQPLKEKFDEIIAKNGWKLGEKDIAQILKEVAQFVKGSATYNMDYDRSLDSSSDIVYNFLFNYKEGICQHYATSATILLRYIGIPARYTGGYVGETVAGQWAEVTSKNAHAWTEAYVDGFGWVQLEVTGGGPAQGIGGGSGSGGSDSTQIGKLNIKPVDEHMLYDGISTLTSSGKLQGLYDLEQRGYTYKVVVSGSQKAVGIGTSHIESFTLYDPSKNDVTESFEITFSDGILQVYVGKINVSTEGDHKVYDGTPLIADSYSIESQLLHGHKAEVVVTGSQKDVGSNINTFDITVYDAEGNDVTYMYWVIADYGILEVEARAITIVADSATQKYSPDIVLTADGYNMTEGTLADNHSIEVVIFGSQSKIGYSDNVVESVKIYDAENNDVTANYIIKTQNGRLTVKP